MSGDVIYSDGIFLILHTRSIHIKVNTIVSHRDERLNYIQNRYIQKIVVTNANRSTMMDTYDEKKMKKVTNMLQRCVEML